MHVYSHNLLVSDTSVLTDRQIIAIFQGKNHFLVIEKILVDSEGIVLKLIL